MTVSSVGDPLTAIAIVVTAFALTHNAIAVAATYGLRSLAAMLAAGALGGAVDKLDRRRLIIIADLLRAATLCATPFAAQMAAWTLFPAVIILGGAGALAQAAREAAVPQLMKPSEFASANAVVAGATTISQAIGYPLAGIILWATASTTPMFVLDAATFIIAALITTGAHGLGGGVASTRIGGALRATWALPPSRFPLLIAGSGALLISITLPALVILAYQLSRDGARAYTILEVVITVGMVVGAVVLGFWNGFPVRVATLLGLALMGGLSLVVSMSPWLGLTSAALLLASVGNQLYVVGNRSEIQQAVPGDRRGSVMATRAVVAETLVIVGSGLGGVLTGLIGGRMTYGLVAAGLLVLAGIVSLRHFRLGLPKAPVGGEPPATGMGLSIETT